ncbi:MAG: DMT family transporter, partial [Paracoccaceae bacterium]|nr:DMT family transporter [Paracoccaceae bacterium]
MNDCTKGVLIVSAGALLYAPDSLMLRLMAMDQWPTVFWRGLLGGAVVMLAYVTVYRGKYPSMLRGLGWAAPAFIVAYVMTTVCFVYAIRETSVANTLFIVAISPVFSAIISWLALKETPDRRTIRTIALALIGVSIIDFGAEDGGPNSLPGDIAAVGAALFLALMFVVSRAVRPRSMSPLVGPAGLVSAVVAGFLVADFSIPAGSLWPLLAMSLIIMPIATWCLTTGPRLIPAPEVSLLMLIEAVFGPLIVWWALSEYPGDATLIGGA